jgi:hypothetical protein
MQTQSIILINWQKSLSTLINLGFLVTEVVDVPITIGTRSPDALIGNVPISPRPNEKCLPKD